LYLRIQNLPKKKRICKTKNEMADLVVTLQKIKVDLRSTKASWFQCLMEKWPVYSVEKG
jgi:hypothetical protein